MGKKHKYYGKKNYKEYDSSKKKSKKSGKGKNDDYYNKPAMKHVSPSLDKKDIRENYKIITTPIKIPEDLTKNRARCNHAGEVMSVKAFKELTPSYGAYTPMLDTACRLFGEENLVVCSSCYEVLMKPSMVDSANVEEAIALLHMAANMVQSRLRMKKDEIRKISKLRDALSDWNRIMHYLEKIESNGNAVEGSAIPADKMSKLNDVM